MTDITDNEFKEVVELVYSQFGIKLSAEKRGLVTGRLAKVLMERDCDDFSQYLEILKADTSLAALSEFVDRLTTNHTFFFRESEHFDYFQNVALPQIAEAAKAEGSNDIRIWCAGCATGEEPYTLLMLMKEFFGDDYKKWNAGLLATDISQRALATAKTGVYNAERLKALPPALRSKYFIKSGADAWQIRDEIKAEITFRRFNLMNGTFPFKKPFHAIFCRNVMIYFDAPTREALLARFNTCAAKGTYLFIGHSETLGRGNEHFSYIKPALYRKNK